MLQLSPQQSGVGWAIWRKASGSSSFRSKKFSFLFFLSLTYKQSCLPVKLHRMWDGSPTVSLVLWLFPIDGQILKTLEEVACYSEVVAEGVDALEERCVIHLCSPVLFSKLTHRILLRLLMGVYEFSNILSLKVYRSLLYRDEFWLVIRTLWLLCTFTESQETWVVLTKLQEKRKEKLSEHASLAYVWPES